MPNTILHDTRINAALFDSGLIRDEEDLACKKLAVMVCDFAKEFAHPLDDSPRTNGTLLKFEYNAQRLSARIYADRVGQPP